MPKCVTKMLQCVWVRVLCEMHESPAVCTVGITESTATIMLKHWTHTSIPVVGSLQSFKHWCVVFSNSQVSGSKLAMFMLPSPLILVVGGAGLYCWHSFWNWNYSHSGDNIFCCQTEHETHICMLLTGQGLHCKKKIGCFNHWVVTLVARDSGLFWY